MNMKNIKKEKPKTKSELMNDQKRSDYVKNMSIKKETHREYCIRTDITQYDL